ncbi:heme-binding protein 2-like [Carcharodon carcharias]|uniref:heme-binding protein 2-like n=1 Tax=Carcharodon carcharias TaxID=13397 RepID=UPI001B7F4583|nr:heme-binding protein 2-like [Carcharodon carcharias]
MLLVLVVTLHLLSQSVLAQRSRKPYFCSEAEECYSFLTICRDPEYEARAYEPSVWVGSRVLPTEGRYRAVSRLRDYFNKKNRPGIQIERTAPLITTYMDINGELEATNVYLVLPRRFFTNPPYPRDIMLFLRRMPPMTIFVKSFGGWITSLRQKSQDMFEDLLRKRDVFLQDRFYSAEYNGPLTLFNRHNEIWYLSLGPPRCEARNRQTQ